MAFHGSTVTRRWDLLSRTLLAKLIALVQVLNEAFVKPSGNRTSQRPDGVFRTVTMGVTTT